MNAARTTIRLETGRSKWLTIARTFRTVLGSPVPPNSQSRAPDKENPHFIGIDHRDRQQMTEA
jgi:hypothetical protein